MELGKDFSSHLKAKNFLGFLSIRNGIFVVSFTQLLLGIALYCILHYLHPSLYGVKWFLLGLHVLVAVLGFVGAFKRSMGFHVAYMVFYAASMVFIAMIALDMSEIVHFLPKAPQMHDVSLFNAKPPLITKFKAPKSNILFPFNFYKDPFLSDAGVELPDFGKGKLVAKYSVTEIDLHNPKNPVVSYSRTITNDPFDANYPNGNMDSAVSKPNDTPGSSMDDLNNLKKLLREKLDNTNPTNNSTNAGADNTYNVNVVPDNSSTSPSTPTANPSSADSSGDKSAAAQDSGDKKDSFYDHIPFLPHPGETEGESEEVSKDEFPPETNDLSPEGKSEVVVMYKMQKRSVKFATSAFLLVCLLFYVYSYWVALTFAMNKCTCLDELSAQPDQFSPLID